MIRVRFAPAPTGYLHIGNARTALFNWLFARHHHGKFLLRIEDTDKERSTQENIDIIYRSLKWLGIEWDESPILQSENATRHQEVALGLLKQGKAYPCYCQKEELEKMRQDAENKGLTSKYPGICRHRKDNPRGITPVIRLKMPIDGYTEIHDLVQGKIKVENNTLDDMILLRQDHSPVYMLSAVVDDHDMNITHIIRGADHLTNAFRQIQLYKALDWKVPEFAHIPLIHGEDGTKLSKRHGALALEYYQHIGILSEAMCNYLLRLGWGHGNDEIISRKQAIEWFDMEGIGKSPARFDQDKLLSLNSFYIREKDNASLINELEKLHQKPFSEIENQNLLKGMDELKKRAKTIVELYENAKCYFEKPEYFENITFEKNILKSYIYFIKTMDFSKEETILESSRNFSSEKNMKLIQIAQPLRVALTGKTVSPSVFQIMSILGLNETISRIESFLAKVG